MAENSHPVSLEDSPASKHQDSPASTTEEVDPLADSPVTTEQGHSPATPDQGHSLGTPDQGHSIATPFQGITLSSLTQQQLTADCEELVDSMLTQAVICSEQGVHGLGQDTTCLSPTCSLGGVSPISDLSATIAELVSSNVCFRSVL